MLLTKKKLSDPYKQQSLFENPLGDLDQAIGYRHSSFHACSHTGEFYTAPLKVRTLLAPRLGGN